MDATRPQRFAAPDLVNSRGESVRDPRGDLSYQLAIARPPLFADDAEIWKVAVLPLLDMLALRASDVLGRRMAQIVVRDMLLPPADPQAPPLGADDDGGDWWSAVALQLPASMLIGIAGVFADYPRLRRLRIRRGAGTVVAACNVAGWASEVVISAQDGSQALARYIKPTWFTPRMIFNPCDDLIVEANTRPTRKRKRGRRRLDFIAFVAEVWGEHVSPVWLP